jgi:hypothetical protein
MALYFSTRDPGAWEIDEDVDFTYAARPWEGRAWFESRIEEGRLAFYIVAPKGTHISTATYAVYHGRLIESMLLHCDDFIAECSPTALPAGHDRISPDD